jgi:hypothetical protein
MTDVTSMRAVAAIKIVVHRLTTCGFDELFSGDNGAIVGHDFSF